MLILLGTCHLYSAKITLLDVPLGCLGEVLWLESHIDLNETYIKLTETEVRK